MTKATEGSSPVSNDAGPSPVEVWETIAKPESADDNWFDTWLIAKGEPLKRLVEATVSGIGFHESRVKPRERRRQAKAQIIFNAIIEMVVCNLVRQMYLKGAKDRIAYSRSKMNSKSRYINPLYVPETVSMATDWMKDYEAVELTTGKPGVASTMRFTPWLLSMATRHGVALSDIGRHPNEELIYLSSKTKDTTWQHITKNQIEYVDNEETHKLRNDLRIFNSYLETADIDFIDDGEAPVDTTARRLLRHFSLLKDQEHSFVNHGRLYGGFWINLEKHRRAHIRVQGESCVDLDFSSMFISLAYAEIGQQVPEGDLYDMTGYLAGYDTEKHRSGIKAAFNAALFGSALAKLPKGVMAGTEAAIRKAAAKHIKRKWLPKGTTLAILRAAFDAKHPLIKQVWGSLSGYGYFKTESDILLGALGLLKDQNVVGLACHDGLLVPASKAKLAHTLMVKASKAITGVELIVKSKPFPPAPNAALLIQ